MAEAEEWPLPINPDEFDKDERISFSKLDNKYIAVQDDGTEYEFDEAQKRWVPIDYADDDLNEGGIPNFDSEAQQPAPQGTKRKLDDWDDREDNNSKNSNSNNGYNNNTTNNNKGRPSKNPKRTNQRGPPQPKQNTAVYVTGLPLDATVDEVAELFSRKCGVIAEEIDSGRPRIKMYTDSEGKFKGDALVVFFKPESVHMAIMLLDDTEFRLTGDPNAPRMRVMEADSSYKKVKYDTAGDGEGADGKPASQAQAQAPPRRSEQEKAKIIRKTQKLASKLADWSDDESHAAKTLQPPKKWERVVILRNMFTLEELRDDPTAILDIKEDVREECEKLGPVTNVVLYDLEEEGIVTVKFKTREAAEECLRLMHGRAFGGRIIEAYFATGRERFRKSKGDVKEEGKKDESEDED